MLNADQLLDEARRAAALVNYGDMTFTEGLRVLVDSINTETRLTEPNERRLQREMVKLLVNRLRMQHDIERHPEILEVTRHN